MSLEKIDKRYGCVIFLFLYALFAIYMLTLAMKADKKRTYRKEIDQKTEQIWEDQNETKTR